MTSINGFVTGNYRLISFFLNSSEISINSMALSPIFGVPIISLIFLMGEKYGALLVLRDYWPSKLNQKSLSSELFEFHLHIGLGDSIRFSDYQSLRPSYCKKYKAHFHSLSQRFFGSSGFLYFLSRYSFNLFSF